MKFVKTCDCKTNKIHRALQFTHIWEAKLKDGEVVQSKKPPEIYPNPETQEELLCADCGEPLDPDDDDGVVELRQLRWK